MKPIHHLSKELFINSTDNAYIQLFRYLFIGGFAFLVDFGLLYLLTDHVHLPYLHSACFSFIAGLTVNYFLSIKWVFNKDNKDVSSAFTDFLGFAIIGLIGLGLNALIMWIATEHIGTHYLVSKIISTIMVFFWNFIGRKYFIDKTQHISQLIVKSRKYE